MRNKIKLVGWVLAATGGLVTATVCAAGLAGLRINTTHSLPQGLYWQHDEPAGVGDLAAVCPPDSEPFRLAAERSYIPAAWLARCPNGLALIFKEISAAQNDVVSIGSAGISVNGKLVPRTQRKAVDSAGRALPQPVLDDYKLKAGEIMLVANHSPMSFDARYFGIIDESAVRGVIRPLWIW